LKRTAKEHHFENGFGGLCPFVPKLAPGPIEGLLKSFAGKNAKADGFSCRELDIHEPTRRRGANIVKVLGRAFDNGSKADNAIELTIRKQPLGSKGKFKAAWNMVHEYFGYSSAIEEFNSAVLQSFRDDAVEAGRDNPDSKFLHRCLPFSSHEAYFSLAAPVSSAIR
jgi:hypothetical protein